MKSGLGDRNNSATPQPATTRRPRAMKSGLRDRNNGDAEGSDVAWPVAVSMKSGLRDRNNCVELGGGHLWHLKSQ